ncbi:MAG: hypothetical protein ACJ8EY_01525 [Sphingomicrobium sp.]
MEADFQYYQRRATQERLAAAKARHPHARAAHLEMEERYQELLRALLVREPQPELQIYIGF